MPPELHLNVVILCITTLAPADVGLKPDNKVNIHFVFPQLEEEEVGVFQQDGVLPHFNNFVLATVNEKFSSLLDGQSLPYFMSPDCQPTNLNCLCIHLPIYVLLTSSFLT
jgi:hypothetical protein